MEILAAWVARVPATIKENPMGRPINKKWFGIPDGTHHKIIVDGVMWSNGSMSTDVYILRQTGTRTYIVSDGSTTEQVSLVNAPNSETLRPGQCYILAKIFGGTEVPCYRISQYRMSVFEADGTIGNYSWGIAPASRKGQADLNLVQAVEPVPTPTPSPTPDPETEPGPV